jgi:hypothetical protein
MVDDFSLGSAKGVVAIDGFQNVQGVGGHDSSEKNRKDGAP